MAYVGRPPAGQEIPWWHPRVTLPDGEAVPLLSEDGAIFFLADSLFGHFFADWFAEPLVDDWWTQMHPDENVVA